ncbi:MAG: VWA domain-containing protein [Bryobacterales bacterium]|nr:VWA domain-containing protein [Bryobacterales bacterium]
MGRTPARALMAALALACAAPAQTKTHTQPPATPTFRSDVRLVRLLVTVKDGSDALVGTLGQDDFAVTDSGVGQTISIFERTTAQPLSISLLIDVSGSTAKDLKFETGAAARFLRAITREGNERDSLALYAFNDEVTLVVNFTRDARRIERGLKSLSASAGTSLYDALTLSSERLEGRDGRHVIIVISDGGDTTSRTDYHAALRSLHRADTVLYPVVVIPITSDAGRNIGGENALTQLARSTGGRAFFPGVERLDETFTEILRDLRTQYLLAYYPKALPAPADGGFRAVQVQVKPPGLRAISRGGYYEE